MEEQGPSINHRLLVSFCARRARGTRASALARVGSFVLDSSGQGMAGDGRNSCQEGPTATAAALRRPAQQKVASRHARVIRTLCSGKLKHAHPYESPKTVGLALVKRH